MKTGRTSLKAKLWVFSVGDGVHTVVEALMGNRPVKEVGQQGVGDRSDHFLGATFPFRWWNQRVHGPVLGPDHG